MVLKSLWYYALLHGIVLAMLIIIIYYFIVIITVIGLVAGLDPEEEVTDVVCDESELRDGE